MKSWHFTKQFLLPDGLEDELIRKLRRIKMDKNQKVDGDMTDAMYFKRDFATGNLIPHKLWHFNLASGARAIVLLEPDGLHITVPQTSIDNSDVRVYDSNIYHHLGEICDQALPDDKIGEPE